MHIDASRFSTDGYRDYSSATRDVVNLRAAALDTPLGRLRITLNALDIPEAEDPLGLTRAQWQEDPRQASPQALQFRTRKSTEQQQLGAQLAGDIARDWSYQAAAWGGRRSVTQFQAIPVAVQAPPNHPGGVIDFDRTYGGVDARVQLALDALTLTLGANVERLDEDRRGYENFTLQPALTLGTLGRLRRDESNIVESRDIYAQVESGIGPGWRLHAGVRAHLRWNFAATIDSWPTAMTREARATTRSILPSALSIALRSRAAYTRRTAADSRRRR